MTRTTRALTVFVLTITIAAAFFMTRRSSRQTTPPGGVPSARLIRGGELVASLRSEPTTYNRYVDQTAASELLSLLTQAPLVRVNRTTDTLEPWLAESWSESSDGLTYTIKLRQGIAFSDGTPFTSADVVFSFRALYDPAVHAGLAADTYAGGEPLRLEAPDASTVIVRLSARFGPGLRLIEGVPILPRHKLEVALDAGKFADAWSVQTPAAALAGLGPFVLSAHVSGQRLAFVRNPRYWRRDAAGVQLPYLDTLTVLVVPDQNTEALRMQAGEIDLMANGEIRGEDYAAFKRGAAQGGLRLIDGGVGLDPNLLWFNLSSTHAADPRGWLRQKAFRQAVSCAVDRQSLINTVYLGAAVPVYGPMTPAHRLWYSDIRPACEHDPVRVRTLLASAGLTDKNGDGMLEDASGKPARFSVLTQRGHSIRERTVSVLQEQLRQAGLTVDVVMLDVNALGQRWSRGDYDSIYFGVQASATDPALNSQFWLSSGNFHFWNPGQATPSTEWERQVDDLMHRQAVAPQLTERQRLFADMERIFVDELPAIYFAASKVTLATSARVANPQPAPQIPQLLWSADTLAATGPGR